MNQVTTSSSRRFRQDFSTKIISEEPLGSFFYTIQLQQKYGEAIHSGKPGFASRELFLILGPSNFSSLDFGLREDLLTETLNHYAHFAENYIGISVVSITVCSKYPQSDSYLQNSNTQKQKKLCCTAGEQAVFH